MLGGGAAQWSKEVEQLLGLGGHIGRVFKVTVLFASAVILLLVLYKVRTTRITNEESKQLLQRTRNSFVPVLEKWVIVANPDDNLPGQEKRRVSSPDRTLASKYLCSLVRIAGGAGWKTVVIGEKLNCCRVPECESVESTSLVGLPYRSAAVLRHLLGHLEGREKEEGEPFRQSIRNIAFLNTIKRGAKFIFDAYVEQYIQEKVKLEEFEEELSRQLRSFALDDSLSLVEDPIRGRRSILKQNPYKHFGGGRGSRMKDFPSYRICEVKPPSIEKFLEIDDGWWDFGAPSLFLPGDTMPPLYTRNSLFSPELFWALPILPDYKTIFDGIDAVGNLSIVSPWYLRGLWTQSLLGDLGGSIRLSLSKLPTLTTPELIEEEREGKRILKRWNCRSKSTFRCLLLISRELGKLVHFGQDDLSLIEAWITDLKGVHYTEPRMLSKRRSVRNPCLAGDGLHGVSFQPTIKPNPSFSTPEFIAERNETLRELVVEVAARERIKRELFSEEEELSPPGQRVVSHWALHSHPEYSEYVDKADWKQDSYLPQAFHQDGGNSREKYFHSDRRRNRKEFRAFLQEIVRKSISEGTRPSEFPILKGMAESVCPGYGSLLPYQPEASTVHSDILLIIALTNHHYDLIPTFELLYRGNYPNILYCGHPHESIDLYLRKYQTAEHRSFSFLPTYTKASYECVLGAIEMGYDLKGYLVISDETLVGVRKTLPLDRHKLWVTWSGIDPVMKSTWDRIDPGGHKLPRLLQGITSAWKLFSYILSGQDSEGRRLRRDVEEEETLIGEETAFVGQSHYWKRAPEKSSSDLAPSDWDYIQPRRERNGSGYVTHDTRSEEREEEGEDEVLLGEEEEEEEGIRINASMEALLGLNRMEMKSSSENPNLMTSSGAPSMDQNLSLVEYDSSFPTRDDDGNAEGVGVPLYHAEHLEPPSHPKWHPPDSPTLSSTTDSQPTSTMTPASSSVSSSGSSSSEKGIGVPGDDELRLEMESLLDGLEETYSTLINILSEYELSKREKVEGGLGETETDFSSEIGNGVHWEDSRSHRISPGDFRHIHCTPADSGQESELCGILRSYLGTLTENGGGDVRLVHGSIPMFYVPEKDRIPFYSIANVLLHYGVSDELGLPLLFSGLAKESDWILLNRTRGGLDELESDSSTTFLYPFDLHSIHGNGRLGDTFCQKYLLNLLSV